MATKKSLSQGVQYKVDDKYTTDKYPYTNQPDPKKKGKTYCRKKAEAIYACIINNNAGIYMNDQNNFGFLRRYGKGEQPVDIYKDYFNAAYETTTEQDAQTVSVDRAYGLPWFSADDKREGWMNVLWNIVSYAPKIKNRLLSVFKKADYDITIDAIDERSGAEREKKKYELWVIAQNIDFYRKYFANMGAEFEEPEFIPETLTELELYDERGGFKPEHARALELLIIDSMRVSNWDEVKDKIMEDAIDLGLFAVKDYWDPVDKRVKSKYIDVAMAGVEYSKHNDFHDANYAGHFEYMTIEELRQTGKFKEAQLRELAQYYAGWQDNPNEDVRIYQQEQPIQDGTYHFDFYKVCVFCCEWIDSDVSYQVVGQNKYGKKRIRDVEYSDAGKMSDKDRENSREFRKRYKYGCKWIVGSQYMLEWGKVFDNLRSLPNTVNLSYHFYKLPTPSITKQLFPIYDNFMILWVKYQNALAKARTRGYAIDYDAVRSIKIGDESNPELKAMRRFIETGVLFFKRTGPNAVKGGGIPVHEMPGDISEIFKEFQEGFAMNLNLVEHLTGFNPLTLGGTPQPDAPVATSELSYVSTHEALRVIMDGYLRIKKFMADNVSMWSQLKLKTDPEAVKAFKNAIGEKNIKVLQIAEANKVLYGLNAIPRPTDEEWNIVIQSAMEALKNGRDGKPGITEADFFSILHLKNSGGSLKLAEMILEYSIRRSQQEAAKEAKEAQMLQGKIDQERIDKELKRELILKQQEADLEYRNDRAKHDDKMKEIKLQNDTKPEKQPQASND